MGIALAVAGLACLLAAAKRAPPFAGTNIEAGLETLTKGNGRVEARQLRHRFDAVIGCFQQRRLRRRRSVSSHSPTEMPVALIK